LRCALIKRTGGETCKVKDFDAQVSIQVRR